ncbi:MAG: 1-deoxy-D-xylulose-5-phosphate synthase [Bacteroidia bacterium]|nr:1-deoxy-D-xylulose-5-phosphate synthase [Bacteroidia bacterium]
MFHNSNINKLQPNDLKVVCENIRKFLIVTILQNGGHFAGNLGVVELSVAIHHVFNSPYDKFIWDVGHQAYIHKILTNRFEEIKNIRNYGGISGFPKITESEHDAFGTGHSSTAISAAAGMAKGFQLKGENDRTVIAIVGDGALTGGMSFEALNNLVATNSNVLVIVNDNHIGIDPSTGALDRHLPEIQHSPSNLFQNLGLPYFGPIDGHNLNELILELNLIKSIKGPRVLHVKTIKGKGYEPAENEQTRWHSTNKFVKIKPATGSNQKWQELFGKTIIALSEKHSDIVGITPAMPSGSGMAEAMKMFPERFFDVGIAEQHAVTFSAGLALTGLKPYLNIYSTFLQRGYDQLIHDVALQDIPVIFCIDRAGLVGEDGPTHHGTFDISFLRIIPNIILTAPSCGNELRELMELAYQTKKPFAIRYPKGNVPAKSIDNEKLTLGKGKCVRKGKDVAVISTGIASQFAATAIALSKRNVSHFHYPFIKPFDIDLLKEIAQSHEYLITVEDGAILGGFGEMVGTELLKLGWQGNIQNLGIPDNFIEHGANEELYKVCGYSEAQIAQVIEHYYS